MAASLVKLLFWATLPACKNFRRDVDFTAYCKHFLVLDKLMHLIYLKCKKIVPSVSGVTETNNPITCQ